MTEKEMKALFEIVKIEIIESARDGYVHNMEGYNGLKLAQQIILGCNYEEFKEAVLDDLDQKERRIKLELEIAEAEKRGEKLWFVR